jgi:hypothetical protein
MYHLDALSKCQRCYFAVGELVELSQGGWVIWEQIGLVFRILFHLDRPVADAIVNPVGLDVK